jgi:hypothetical protein
VGAGEGSTTVVLVPGGGPAVVLWRDLDATAPDLGLVEVFARWALAARRLGWELEVREPSPDLRDLLELAGLTDLLCTPRPTAADTRAAGDALRGRGGRRGRR